MCSVTKPAVFKYPLHKAGLHQVTVLEIPSGGEFLDVQLQHGLITFWALVDTLQPPVRRYILVAATGVTYPVLDSDDAEYLGTVQLTNGIVVHLFEVPENATVDTWRAR